MKKMARVAIRIGGKIAKLARATFLARLPLRCLTLWLETFVSTECVVKIVIKIVFKLYEYEKIFYKAALILLLQSFSA